MSRPTNCINCGAVLTSWKCEYCGTEYENSMPNEEDLIDITTFGDNERIFLDTKTGEIIRSTPKEIDVYCDKNGVLHRCWL